MTFVWIVAVLAFVAAEAATVGLVSIWFALGSLAALVAAVLGAKLWLQLVLFIVISGAVLALVRPFAKKYINVRKRPTNADRVIGVICPVTEDIDNIAGKGAVTVGGKVWTARSASGTKILAGTLVKPLAIQGVKLIVEEAAKPAEAVR